MSSGRSPAQHVMVCPTHAGRRKGPESSSIQSWREGTTGAVAYCGALRLCHLMKSQHIDFVHLRLFRRKIAQRHRGGRAGGGGAAHGIKLK